MDKNAYYFALSAAAAAAVTASPQVAKAVCECTLHGIAPSIIKSQGGGSFTYGGSQSAGYDAIMVQDSQYGFTGTVAPQVYFDYWLYATAAGTYTTTAQICRESYLGTQINCGTTKSQAISNPGGTIDKEMGPISVSNTYGAPSATLSVWDLVRMKVFAPANAIQFNPRSIPSVEFACW
jgi:hypothetical protein